MSTDYDILIAGGGAAGASLALALGDTPLRVALVDPAGPARGGTALDQRGLALSAASVRILDSLGVWPALRDHACPIRRVHVSEAGRFGSVRLDAGLLRMDALGYVVPAAALGAGLREAIAALPAIRVLQGSVRRVAPAESGLDAWLATESGEEVLRCRLLVAADGAQSLLRDALGIGARIHDYRQNAVVASVKPGRPHDESAWERFSPSGPAALLPLRDGRCVAVMCVHRDEAETVMAESDEAFLERLDRRFGRRHGGFSKPGPRGAWPLMRVVAERRCAHRAVLLGNAAHTVHPNGAQGFNLAIRDAAALAERLKAAAREGADPGAASLLESFVADRKADHAFVGRYTHGLASLFCTDEAAPRMARRAAMLFLERLPPLKRALVWRATGLGTAPPRAALAEDFP